MAHFKLQDAFLCIDCDVVHNRSDQCPVCLSHALHPISAFLNRVPYKDLRFDERLPLGMMPDIEDAQG